MKQMTVFGVGKQIVLVVALYLAVAIYLSLSLPEVFRFTVSPNATLYHVGLGMFIIGWIINFAVAFQMIHGFKSGKLVTSGFYALSPNPMYSVHVILSLPGLGLMLNSWLVALSAVVLYVTYQSFVRAEEEWLVEKFGDAYREYRKRVWLKFF